ncbi:glycoside hydrolase domain-containing protein [Lapidilactobacillus gannanensis]|jgi:peptidoglycan hydrolase-like protein with peptidoglycan-binding domain|uniref:Glycoside hydrolase domain-containing protein n=1 Tax=Lapidilactobacillus gannanensis TaxID=2486002 RepID=A0ABW4BKE2_9LACO|nr:glycoside hydrolase domain-containing protein [Lapidilactobacillus gannanensis]MCH4056807.1 DUF1906 domain-containing protein [Lactobacillaceae bacterium]
MADEMVLEVQKWLNTTYAGKAGYDQAPEDGQTGWSTIYSLREGLQIETHAEGVGQGFGEATRAAVAKIVSQLKPGYANKNITKLIKGAFWCKGITPSDFSDVYSAATQAAFEELQSDAGLTANGVVTVNLMAALFDMSAFVLVPSGKEKVRALQQWLNSMYSNYTGILPCDGIYQRDTNVALIYALQRALGMAATTANGNFGPGTDSALKNVVLSVGSNSEIARIVQYGLYLNGFYGGTISTAYTSAVGAAVQKFSEFMKYDNVSNTAGYTVIKGLVTSNGDTNRNSNAMDCATQLTASDVKNMHNIGFDIVGRYLTGTVGTGSSERAKNLTSTEVKAILDNGMKFFPIYEDGGYYEGYFTAAQGTKDAQLAAVAAANLGLPYGTTIYFAVDVDVQDGDIAGTILPYLKAVASQLSGSWYRPGVYGTRNVCLHAQDSLGYKNSYVADMSYGWSGNLGFRMPENWAFDQFVEYTAYGIDIDQSAASGRDAGVSKISTEQQENPQIFMAHQLMKKFPAFNDLFADVNWTVATPEQHITTVAADYYMTLTNEWSGIAVDDQTGVLNIKDGQVMDAINDTAEDFNTALSGIESGDYLGTFNELAPMIGNGAIKAGLAIRNGAVGIKVSIEGSTKVENSSASLESKYTLTMETYVHRNIPNLPVTDYDNLYNPVSTKQPFELPVTTLGICLGITAVFLAVIYLPVAAVTVAVATAIDGVLKLVVRLMNFSPAL